ncbi:MAG TPA: MarR family transcriptional regulator [Nocardioidaceae bacterium]|nr:MarR family transcriptional regulator [Nocardioidaceae bacterium]
MEFNADEVRATRERLLLRLLFRATHTMNADMAARLRARGWEDFRSPFTGVLSHLDTEGTTVTTLAERTGTTRQAVSQLTQTMERAGLLERVPNPHDRRSVMLRHTESGRRILLDAIEVMTEIEHEYAGLIGAGRADELKRLLGSLVTEIDPRGALHAES